MTDHVDGRLLIVDDDSDVLQGLSEMLEGEGFQIRTCPDAFSALEFVEYDNFDVVLSDIKMPAVSGLELLEHVHRFDPDIPVIMMTGQADIETAIAAVKCHAFDFIHKPFDPEILLSVLARALNYRRLREAEREYSGLLKKTVVNNTKALKQQIEDLRQARDAAMESSRLKSEFMANMTHEIRTPLHGMVGLMEILCSREHTTEQARCYAMLQSSIDRLSSLLNNVLDFSKMTSGAFELSPRLFSLSVLVETLVRTYTPKAKSKGLLLTVDIDDKLPDMLFADDVRLRQVMAIILDNAVKFTHSGNICIALQPAEETPPTESDKVSHFCYVSDTGVGIKPDQVDKIFEGFTQADGSFTRKHEGAGLGLAIARQTIRSMGGTLWVESSPGSGSAFLFRVPSGEKEA